MSRGKFLFVSINAVVFIFAELTVTLKYYAFSDK
jgi:hypothetical protein